MAEWVQAWETERIPNCEKFMLTGQTGSALVRTLLSFASLIEDLLGDFVLTSRFQNNLLETRFGQYQQMSGGGFLVRPRYVTSSKKVIKIKSLLKEDLDSGKVRFKTTNDDETTVDYLVIQALSPVLQNIFLYQMTAGK